VQPNVGSCGIDLEALNECIAGLAFPREHDLIFAVQPRAPSIKIDRYGVVNRGHAPSDEISGIAEGVEDAEAAKTKKATMREEETSCSFSDGAIGNSTTEISGTEATMAAKTKKINVRAWKSAPKEGQVLNPRKKKRRKLDGKREEKVTFGSKVTAFNVSLRV
jgi:hypothetical protein